MGTAAACPLIEGMVDYNCDGEIRIVAVGDSIVFGRGDLENGNSGGWVLRLPPLLARDTAKVKTFNLGFPGISSTRLLQKLSLDYHRTRSKVRRKSTGADIVIVSVGVNDFFEEGMDPGMTVRNIRRIVSLVRREVGRISSATPYVIVAKPTPTTRGYQAPYLADIGTLLARYRSFALPSYLRFDLMNPLYVSVDGLHPFATGYDELAHIAADFLLGDAQNAMKSARPDSDKDGVYDYFERTVFLTDPKEKDSDGDGLKDGEEIFTLRTDPLLTDTDGDGIIDSEDPSPAGDEEQEDGDSTSGEEPAL